MKIKTSLMFLGALLPVLPAHAVIPQQGELLFDIYRNGKPFGTHRLVFDQDGDKTRVQIDINMEYALGPVTLFRYDHSNMEVWKGDNILSLVSETDDDGTDYKVEAAWGRQMEVSVNGDNYAAEPMYTTSYWNPVALKDDQLLNTQKGKIEPVTVQFLGVEEFQTPSQTLKAKHYSVEASVPLELWYEEKTGQWLGLKFNARGSDFEYRRVTPFK